MQAKLKQYYVYELVDPTSNAVFYVGKGQGRRANQHLTVTLLDKSNPEKIQRIMKIRGHGLEPAVRVVGRYTNEEEAFAVEATLIHWVYGRNNLVNIQAGHGSSTIRNHGDTRELEGIDIPRSIRSPDGRYTEALRRAREENSIVPLMTSLRDYLTEELEVGFTDPDTSRADRTRIYSEFEFLRIRLGAFHSKSPAIVLRVEACGDDVQEFRQFSESNGLCFTDKKRQTAKLKDFDKSSDFRVVCEKVREVTNCL